MVSLGIIELDYNKHLIISMCSIIEIADKIREIQGMSKLYPQNVH